MRRKWPLFLGVDQEGGVVERLRRAATRFPTFMSAGAAADPALTRTAYAASGAELRGLGFTVDFAPDADVTSGPGDPTIGSRSASSRPAAVAEHVVAASTGFAESGVLPVIKHFPGHGSVPADSHLTLPVQTKSLEDLESSDLVPFRKAVEAGLPSVMVGHIDVRAIDPRVPSSLSRKVVTGLLRDELGFDGLVVTDSLRMAGVTRGRTPGRVGRPGDARRRRRAADAAVARGRARRAGQGRQVRDRSRGAGWSSRPRGRSPSSPTSPGPRARPSGRPAPPPAACRQLPSRSPTEPAREPWSATRSTPTATPAR